jgi:hypothetical protein
MNPEWSWKAAVVVGGIAVALFIAIWPTPLQAQGMGYGQSAMAMTDDQQSAANSALCSVVGKQVPNPASASPSLLSSRSVITAAASIFASSVHLPLPDATTMLQGYVSQHASDVLASCAVSNATGGVTSKIPGASSMPSIPNVP